MTEPGYGTSMHWPHCRDGRCTGCLPPSPPLEAMTLRAQALFALRCDASVPSYHNDEIRFDCGHEAEVEALWTDGQWHPRCRRHVIGYPPNRVRPLEAS